MIQLFLDGNWGQWSVYSQCSLTCGSGHQSRSRPCNNPAPNGGLPCIGSSTESQNCNTQSCTVGKYEANTFVL